MEIISNIYNEFCNVIFVHWIQALQSVSALFITLTAYSYFYRKYLIKKEVRRLKKEAIIFEIITHNLIDRIMSEQEKYSLKEIMTGMREDFKEFKSEMKDAIFDLTLSFHSYKESNNERVTKLEGGQKSVWKTIGIYVSFIAAFVMLVISTFLK